MNQQAMENLLTRRSVKKYRSTPVPEELIEKIVEAGTYAATGRNLQAPIILAITNGQVRDELLLYAAEICAYYSDGQDGDKIPVDYCKRKFVKKPNKSKAGFVTYTDYKTILVKPNAHKE